MRGPPHPPHGNIFQSMPEWNQVTGGWRASRGGVARVGMLACGAGAAAERAQQLGDRVQPAVCATPAAR